MNGSVRLLHQACGVALGRSDSNTDRKEGASPPNKMAQRLGPYPPLLGNLEHLKGPRRAAWQAREGVRLAAAAGRLHPRRR